MTEMAAPVAGLRNDLLERWAGLDRDRLRDQLTAFIVSEVAAFLHVAPQEIGADESLLDWGVDSLQAADFKLRIERSLGCQLEATLLAEHPTPMLIAELLIEQGVGLSQPAPEFFPQSAGPSPVQVELPNSMPSAAPAPLNVVDRVLVHAHQQLRRAGEPGLPLQFHIWFQGRIQVGALRAAQDRLATRWPALSSVLESRPRMAWRFAAEAAPTIEERHLADASEQTVLSAAEQLMSEPCDLERGPLVRCIVYHRRGIDDDVLVVQIPHPLLDAQGGQTLIKQLLGLMTPPASITEQAQLGDDPIEALDSGRPVRNCLGALHRLWKQRRPGQILTLPGKPVQPWSRLQSPGRVQLQWIDEHQTAALHQFARDFDEPTPLTIILAAAGIRAVRRCQTEPIPPGSRYELPIPYSMRIGRDHFVPFKNLALRTMLTVKANEIDDVGALIASLRGQFAEQRQPPAQRDNYWRLRLGDRVLKHSRRPFRAQFTRTLHTTFIGELVPAGAEVFGAVVDRAYATMFCPPVMRMSLSLWPVGSRLLVVCLYSPDALDEPAVARFLANWRAEIDHFTGRGGPS